MPFIALQRRKINTVNVLCLLLSHFLHLLFALNFVVFVEGGQEYFLPQGAGYPSYATDSKLQLNATGFSRT